MYNKFKTNSPKNAIQLYIDGVRYRSLFSAATDTDITFCLLQKKIKASGGAPIKIHGKVIFSEQWLLKNYFSVIAKNPKYFEKV